MNEVRVFDKDGNLLKVIEPKDFPFEPQPMRKFQPHPCPKCGETTTRKKYCGLCLKPKTK